MKKYKLVKDFLKASGFILIAPNLWSHKSLGYLQLHEGALPQSVAIMIYQLGEANKQQEMKKVLGLK